MGRKRKASSGPSSQPKGPREYNPADARLGPINSYADIADEQEQHFLDQDEILFEDGPKSKRQKALDDEDDFLENSEEEILGYDQDSESDVDEDDDDDGGAYTRKPTKSTKRQDDDGSESGRGEEEEEEGDTGFWGTSRKDYYDADQIETAVDAEEEEKEAARLQKKKLSKMSEKDFFDEDEWLAPEAEDADQNDVVTEVLKDVPIPADMGPEERNRILEARYPELPFLADELLQIQPLLVTLQKEAHGQDTKSLAVVRYRILGSYVAALAMYFAILTSPARDGSGEAKAIDPADLRDHEVMGTLLECREAWKKVEHINQSDKMRAPQSLPSPPEEDIAVIEGEELTPRPTKKSNKDLTKKKTKMDRKAKDIEDSLADLDSLLTAKKRPMKKATSEAVTQDGNSDFGEEELLDAKAAADKAARKKSLRFYTSQIVQKANRRAGAGRDAGGDMDIPYRERFKDRQARLMAEAEKRGKKGSKYGADLGDASDGEDGQVANAVRNDADDEYYQTIASATSRRKDEKAARAAAVVAAGKEGRVVEAEEIDENGKRKITYQIQANKGLAPRRKKEVRNSRVKKRRQYKDKVTKLKSMKAVYSGGPGRGGYAGEATGIKPGLIKSVKLS
ncbi:Sas10 C-terminal domain-containing protein [Biscogniauxia marginata]|nr:Sas10 C-terminal domain-containing protein [Biscogniauxia marginata]